MDYKSTGWCMERAGIQRSAASDLLLAMSCTLLQPGGTPLKLLRDGVGIVIRRLAEKLIINIIRASDRVLKAMFQGKPTLTVIIAYAPCEYATIDEKASFYNQLRHAIETVPPLSGCSWQL